MKASSKTAVQAAISLLKEEHDSHNQTNSVSVSDNPYILIYSPSMTLVMSYITSLPFISSTVSGTSLLAVDGC